MLELREAHRHSQGTEPAPVTVGDIVIVHSDNQPRGFWKLARVEQTTEGRDGQIRGAIVRVAGSQGRATTLHGPIQCLYLLEVNTRRNEDQRSNLTDTERP